jgi:Uma2 family endonuclease
MNIEVPVASKPIHYPEDDGQPMSENTLQFRWIMTIQGGLDAVFRDRPDVFVAGDLLWYPVEGHAEIRMVPGAMVVFGRPKGDRGSYMQWLEDNLAPQVVFEVLSPDNRFGEMVRKMRFYERYGVEEYYVYDPDRVELTGWRRGENELLELPEMNGWVSPRLGIRFDMSGEELQVFGTDGTPFATYLEMAAQRDRERQAREAAERARAAAEKEATLARERAERLAARLRELGVDPKG